MAWILFGGLVLILLGGAHLTIGGLALLRPEALEGTRADLLLDVGLTTLGWIHLLLGVLLMAVGGGLIMGRVWGRLAAIVLACLSILLNFAFAGVYPIWSVTAIVFSLVVLYATVAHGAELTAAYKHG